MSTSSKDILKEVFGYDDFRSGQEEIIDALLEGKDTLALFPTGAGKSLCYQVPTLQKEGICLVVSPLIALMKDQVDSLKKRGIKATAIYSGMHYREIDRTLDNCIYGQFKFLFVSPERLKNELFIERFKQMPVNLIAVDEAHCISQWGYDFRPPYLEIAECRFHHPKIPMVALTASATSRVCEDILEKLEMKNPKVVRLSFARPKLSFSVRLVENMLEKGVEVLSRISGSAIWYVRNRQSTHQIAKALRQLGINSAAYHAGLTIAERDQAQKDWMGNKVRVMVSTNAFGMGIDKPDVRVVIHSALPENLENYYQEAGRAGRDQSKAFAVLLSNEQDFEKVLERSALVYPPLDFVKRVYQCLANYFQLAVGSFPEESLDFEWSSFANTYNLGVLETFYALKVLEEEGFIQLSESFYSPSRIHFLVNPTELYKVQVAYEKLDQVIKILLRIYGGNLFSEYIKIKEEKISKELNLSEKELVKRLKHLDDLEVMDYDKRKDKPQIYFLTARYDANQLPFDHQRIKQRRELTLENAKKMVAYAHQEIICRTQYIQEYFGEETTERCGICDWCIEQKKEASPEEIAKKLKEKVLKTLEENGELTEEELIANLYISYSERNLKLIREWVDSELLVRLPNGKLKLNIHG